VPLYLVHPSADVLEHAHEHVDRAGLMILQYAQEERDRAVNRQGAVDAWREKDFGGDLIRDSLCVRSHASVMISAPA
jgi:hypothetical protein